MCLELDVTPGSAASVGNCLEDRAEELEVSEALGLNILGLKLNEEH